MIAADVLFISFMLLKALRKRRLPLSCFDAMCTNPNNTHRFSGGTGLIRIEKQIKSFWMSFPVWVTPIKISKNNVVGREHIKTRAAFLL
jgi:hypothetical protein